MHKPVIVKDTQDAQHFLMRTSVAFGELFRREKPIAGERLLLDASGEAIRAVLQTLDPPVTIALGPEGGLTEEERALFIRGGWRLVSLGANVLRFETAGIAALAIVRAHTGGSQ